MPIEFKVTDKHIKKLMGGALDSEEVWVQFVTQTGEDGEHDPEQPPDDRVRPSHAAFHGKFFKLADAPIPPLDYGCRCAIRYVAKPDSAAAEVMTEADEEPTTTDQATRDWLKENVGPDLQKLQKAAESSTPGEAIGNTQAKAKKLGVHSPRAIAQMVVDVAQRGDDAPGSIGLRLGGGPTPSPGPGKPPAPVPGSPKGSEAPAPAAKPPPAPTAPLEGPPVGVAGRVVKRLDDLPSVDPKAVLGLHQGGLIPLPDETPHLELGQKTAKVLDDEENRAVRGFTRDVEGALTPGYPAIRAADRGDSYQKWLGTAKDTEYTRLAWQTAQKRAALINGAFAKAPTFKGTVYRGLNNIPEEHALLMVQQTNIKFDSMSSASYDFPTARGFMVRGDRPGTVSVMFVMRDAKGMLVQAVSAHPEEGEVLMPKGVSFKVAGAVRTMYRGVKTIVITMDAVP